MTSKPRDLKKRLEKLGVATNYDALNDTWQQSKLLGFRKKINQLLAGAATQNVVIGVYGSSIDRGVDETSVPYNAQYKNSYANWLARLLNASGVPASSNNLFGVGTTTVADLALRDGRFTYAGAVSTSAAAVPGGVGFVLSGAGQSISFKPVDNVDTFVVYWTDNTSGRSINASVDGGAATPIATTNVAQYNRTVIAAGAVGQHTLKLDWVAGGFAINGIDAYDSTKKQVLIWNHACAGFHTGNLNQETGAPGGGRLTFIAKYPVDLAIECGTLTNSWRTSRGVDVSAAELLQWTLAQQAVGAGVIHVTPPYDGGSTGDTANAKAYVERKIQIAHDTGSVLVDWRHTTQSYAAALAAGLLGDNTHLTATNGSVDVARQLKASLML